MARVDRDRFSLKPSFLTLRADATRYDPALSPLRPALCDGPVELHDWAFKQHLGRYFSFIMEFELLGRAHAGCFFTLQDPCHSPLRRVQVIREPIYWHDLSALVGTICLSSELSNN